MMFDQFSRYKACSQLLRQVIDPQVSTILDIGSGPECLLGDFLNSENITFLDPLISNADDRRRICGDINSTLLNGKKYECVVAVDVLEHVPDISRVNFINRVSSLSSNKIILAFPTSDSTDAFKVDSAINAQYKSIFGIDYPWLDEHFKYGLPKLTDVVAQLNYEGWHSKVIGHGHAPWLQELLGYLICIWDIPEMKNFCLQISKQFNEKLYIHDFREPHYREFVIASKTPFEINLDINCENFNIDSTFRDLMCTLQKSYFYSSFHAFFKKDEMILERDHVIENLNRNIKEVSESHNRMLAELQERDRYIKNINKSAEEVSAWAKLLEAKLTKKNKEAVEISDWALQLKNQLEVINDSLIYRLIKKLNKAKVRIFALVKQIIFIKVLKNILYRIKKIKKNKSLVRVKQSVNECNGHLIIAFPIITWDFRWQRPQHILSGLRDAGFSILYLAMTIVPSEKRFTCLSEALNNTSFDNLGKNINQIWLASLSSLNVYSDSIEGDNLRNLFLCLCSVIKKIQPKSIKYIVQFPGWAPLVLELHKELGGKILFDCMDEHTGFSTNTSAVLESELNLIRNSDLVITSSNMLEKKVSGLTNRVIQIKNGTEFKHFNECKVNGELDFLGEMPIIGYFGAISDWFDVDLVFYCAQSRPNYNFVLIGSTFGADISKLQNLQNVFLLGEKSYKSLPGFLAYFDVCLIPFKLIPLTLATNPVKFYEYLSAGKPVVSVRLPELVDYANYCYLADDSKEFLAKIDVAYESKDDVKLINMRLDLARNNSWDSRVKTILKHPFFSSQ